MSKLKKNLLWFAVTCTTICIMCDMPIAPAMTDLANLSGDNSFLANYILSGPALLMMITSLVTPLLLKKISSRNLTIGAFAVFAVSGIAGIAVQNPYYVAAMRTLLGLSTGVINVVALIVLSEVFTDEKERSRYVGLYSTGMTVMGILLGNIATIVYPSGWMNVFKIYYVTVPILVMLIILLPKSKREEAKQEIKAEQKQKFPVKAFALIAISFFVFNIINCTRFYQMSNLLLEHGFETTALAGTISTMHTLGGTAGSLVFTFLYGKIKNKLLSICFLFQAIGFFGFYIAESTVEFVIFALILGFGYMMGYCYFTMASTSISEDPANRATIVSGVQVIYGLSMFLSTYLVTGIKGIMHETTYLRTIPVLIAVLVISAVVELVKGISADKKAKA